MCRSRTRRSSHISCSLRMWLVLWLSTACWPILTGPPTSFWTLCIDFLLLYYVVSVLAKFLLPNSTRTLATEVRLSLSETYARLAR